MAWSASPSLVQGTKAPAARPTLERHTHTSHVVAAGRGAPARRCPTPSPPPEPVRRDGEEKRQGGVLAFQPRAPMDLASAMRGGWLWLRAQPPAVSRPPRPHDLPCRPARVPALPCRVRGGVRAGVSVVVVQGSGSGIPGLNNNVVLFSLVPPSAVFFFERNILRS